MGPEESKTGGHSLVEVTPREVVDGRGLATGDGLLLMVRNAVNRLAEGEVLEVRSADLALGEDLSAWCHITGNVLVASLDAPDHVRYLLRRGATSAKAEQPDWGMRMPRRQSNRLDVRDWRLGRAGQVPEEAPTYYGFVPRGAVPEVGTPEYPYTLNRKSDVWVESAADLYEQAKAGQWNASEDIAWDQLPDLPEAVERAVCQLMTFLAENEYSALYIPAKFLPKINPQYLEPVLFLSTVINDEARHIEAFTKRALANGGGLQYAASMTEWSLHSLLVQEDYFRSSFLLHVLGEGTFLDLLEYIQNHAPDPVTADVIRRARVDEGRHVAFGIAHVREHLRQQPSRAEELVAAAEERSEVLQAASGTNPPVMEALQVLGGGGADPSQMRQGYEAVRALYESMDRYRVRRMLQIGLDLATAEKISMLHTPNFM